jgi:hypothetical protein
MQAQTTDVIMRVAEIAWGDLSGENLWITLCI